MIPTIPTGMPICATNGLTAAVVNPTIIITIPIVRLISLSSPPVPGYRFPHDRAGKLNVMSAASSNLLLEEDEVMTLPHSTHGYRIGNGLPVLSA